LGSALKKRLAFYRQLECGQRYVPVAILRILTESDRADSVGHPCLKAIFFFPQYFVGENKLRGLQS